MKLSIFAVTGGLAGVAFAQSLGGVPDCAKPCVLKFTSGSEIAGCNGQDIACICSNQSFLSSIACCLLPVCSQADQDAAVAFAKQICKTDGITNLPDSVTCSSTTSGSATAASGSSTSATKTESTSSTTSGASASTTPPSTSVATSAAASSSSPSATKNVGPQNMAGVGSGIIGGLAAVLGALI